MFTRVRLNNFKSFAQDTQNIDLRRISVFVGPNGSGKSSVLQAMLIWRFSANGPQLLTSQPMLDLGKPTDVAAGGQTDQAWLGVGVDVKVDFSDPVGPQVVSAYCEATLAGPPEWNFELKSAGLAEMFGQEQITLEGRPALGAPRVTPERLVVREQNLQLAASGALAREPRTTNVPSGFEQEVELLSRVFNVITTSLGQTRYVPAVRGFSQSRYPLGADSTQDVFLAESLESAANQLATTLAYDDDLRSKVSSTLAVLTEVTLDRELSSGPQVSPSTRRKGMPSDLFGVLPTNEGFGTNQLMWLLAQVFMTPQGGTVLIEEPETHLHPLAQVRLGAWLAGHAIEEDKQFVITTHSEHFLRALLWQVRQDVLAPGDLGVFYCNLDGTGHSIVRRKNVTHGGLLQGGFNDFFPAPEDFPGWGEAGEWLKGLNEA